MDEDDVIIVKIVIVGDAGVGKSTLLLRYTDNEFSKAHVSTIGVDFKFKNIQLDGEKVRLQIWDTAGQERFLATTKAYFRGAMGIMMIYDVTDSISFENMRDKWMKHVEEYADQNVNKILVGNKCDLENERGVETREGKELAEPLGIPFYETSALANINVTEVFEKIARDIKAKRYDDESFEQDKDVLRINPMYERARAPKQKKGCCVIS